MPYSLNGNYYLVEEVARRLGRTHSIMCRWIKTLGLTPLVIKKTILLNEEEYAELAKYADGIDCHTTSVPLMTAHQKPYLGVPYSALEKYVKSGDIPSVKDHMGKPRLTEETIYIMQQSGYLCGRKTDWSKVCKLFTEEEV